MGEILWHPDFDYSEMSSDIALMWLSRPLQFSESIAPIEMLDEGVEIADGAETIITGWGHTKVPK